MGIAHYRRRHDRVQPPPIRVLKPIRRPAIIMATAIPEGGLSPQIKDCSLAATILYSPPSGAKVAEGYVIEGASAASFPNSSGANALTVVVRAFPDDVIATDN
jgi:hypothetical protein